jgi:uncharacterized BrkB/YihY/UPF0761 family membrane protein
MKASQPRWLRVALLCRHASATFARIISEAFQRYGRIDGEQCAASFAYYAFFSLFPLILLLVVVGTFFVPDRLQAAREVVQQVEEYVPLQTKDGFPAEIRSGEWRAISKGNGNSSIKV